MEIFKQNESDVRSYCRSFPVVFNKALGFGDLGASLLPMLIAVPIIVGTAIALLRKQER